MLQREPGTEWKQLSTNDKANFELKVPRWRRKAARNRNLAGSSSSPPCEPLKSNRMEVVPLSC